ncbi:MAG: alpha-glucan family phosphorylase [Armatimonadota bacterium]|nr:alpha-glucan family phosphorylase [Armatimonadota bacterium]
MGSALPLIDRERDARELGDREEAIAYFSMEIGLNADIPTYAGGLGVLAGDTLRAAADLGMPMIAVTLLYRNGYFQQHLDSKGNQTETPVSWSPEEILAPVSERVTVDLEGRTVHLRAWRYTVEGVFGDYVNVLFLDTDLPENSAWDRTLTDDLYGGDRRYRLCQEALLGLGGVELLHALGLDGHLIYHMNEGHSALLALGLLERRLGEKGPETVADGDIEAVRSKCVFTTHTPVPAGHDKFAWELVTRVLGARRARTLEAIGTKRDSMLNMTYLALRFSRHINGVALRHGEISADMFPGYPIDSITNGASVAMWTSQPFAELFDRHIPQWRRDNQYLRYALAIPLQEIADAHTAAKQSMLAMVHECTGRELDPEVLTLGFARRATEYKRADLLFADIERLKRIARKAGKLQVLYAGKAHPRDEGGKQMIRRVYRAAEQLRDDIPVVYLEDYDIDLAKHLVSGVDVWLNTPLKPHEASGTSGMKAAYNGIPSLSVLDGWWLEGHIQGVTGWAIGDRDKTSEPPQERADLYDTLQHTIMPLYYDRPLEFARVGRYCIAFNGSFFNTQRMVSQYWKSAYHRVIADGQDETEK